MSNDDRLSESLLAAPDQPDFTYPGNPVRLKRLPYQLMVPALLMILISAAGLLPGWTALLLPPDFLHTEYVANFMKNLARDPEVGYLGLAGGLAGAVNAVWFPRHLRRSRMPLAVTGKGIYAYRDGRPWRFLSWEDVASISKRITDPGGGKPGVTIVRIEGPGVPFTFSPTISEYERLCGLLTDHARKHGIPIVCINKLRFGAGVPQRVSAL